MKEKTLFFINLLKSLLKKGPKNGKFDETWIKLLEEYSSGKCPCGDILEVVSFQKTGSGARWSFKCGHSYNVISLAETVNLKTGYSAAALRKLDDNSQKVSARIGGNEMKKENREIAVVKSLCNYYKPSLTKFYSDEQDSPIDVIAEGTGELENFQVTRLYDKNFWNELYTSNQIDLIVSEMDNLLKNSIKRKEIFDQISKAQINLVIDAWPGVLPGLAEIISKIEIVRKSGFKEVWIAGLTAEMTYRIFPSY